MSAKTTFIFYSLAFYVLFVGTNISHADPVGGGLSGAAASAQGLPKILGILSPAIRSCGILENDLLLATGKNQHLFGLDQLGKKRIEYFDNSCKNFVKGDGTLGAWGIQIAKKIRSQTYETLFLKNPIGGIDRAPVSCPNWPKMSENDRIRYWVWAMMSMAQVESSCDERKHNDKSNGANGKPLGLFQLESAAVARGKKSMRDPVCYQNFNPLKASNNINCALTIMRKQLEVGLEKRKESHLYTSNSYWQELEHDGGGGPMWKLMKLYGPCHKTSSGR